LGALLRHPVALNESVYLKAVNFTFTCTYFNFRSAATVAAARYWRLEPETTKRHSHRCRRSRPAPCARTMKQHMSRCSHSALAHRAHTPKRRSHRCSRSKLPPYAQTMQQCSPCCSRSAFSLLVFACVRTTVQAPPAPPLNPGALRPNHAATQQPLKPPGTGVRPNSEAPQLSL